VTNAPTSTHRLIGLEPDNLMGFLALLGCLRALDALDADEPTWLARAGFDIDKAPLRASLHLSSDVEQTQLCEAIAEGARKLLAELKLHIDERDDLKTNAGEARGIHTAADKPCSRFATDFLAALACDAGRPGDEFAAVSPLCFPTVAQVSFIASLKEFIVAETPTKRNGSSRKLGTPADSIARALFAPWTRADRPAGFRWDNEEARQHAYQWSAPTDDPPTTEHGAARLALIGLSCFPVLPSRETAVTRTPVPGGRTDDGTFTLTWPIWEHSISLAAVRRLLAAPTPTTPAEHEAASRRGVAAYLRTSRGSVSKLISFSRATPVAARP
jgi:hypothetical protein